MEEIGIVPLHFIVENRIVVYESLCDSYNYHFINQKDLEDEEIIRNIYAWYKKVGEVFKVKEDCAFSKNNLVKIMNKFNLFSNETFAYIYNNFDNIKLKIDRAVKPVMEITFSLEHLVVCKSNKKVFGVSFDRLKVGNQSTFINDILTGLKEENSRTFVERILGLSVEEKIACHIHELFVVLCYCTELNSEVKMALGEVYSGSLLIECKHFVEWY